LYVLHQLALVMGIGVLAQSGSQTFFPDLHVADLIHLDDHISSCRWSFCRSASCL